VFYSRCMRSVRLVPLDDGDPSRADLLVESEDGERFTLAVDDALRAAITGLGNPSNAGGPADEEAAPVTLHPAPAGPPLTPRDIQVRVRSGESPEDLATDSGTRLDKIMRFALPVLEERARVGDEARRARARRDGDGALVPFGETVDRRFQAHGIDPGAVKWDSFRRPDGSWVVIATWSSGGHDRHAHWAFALAARTVLPADEVAADLLSDRPLRPVVRAVPDPNDDAAPRESVFDQEAPATYVPAAPAAPVDSAPRPAAPPLPLRLADPLPPADGAEGTDGADETASANPTDTDDADADPDGDAASADAITGSIGFAELFDRNVIEPEPEPAAISSAGTDKPDPPKRSRSVRRGKGAREQIPSWEDIMLGVRPKHD
jgi:hypothetical protein